MHVAFCLARYENGVTRVPLSTHGSRARTRENRTARRIARVLKEFRQSRKLSVESLSKRTGLTAARIKKFESGERAPYLDDLFVLAAAFGVQPSYVARRMFDPSFRRKAAPKTVRS